jgi:hypothetical protein
MDENEAARKTAAIQAYRQVLVKHAEVNDKVQHNSMDIL